MHERHIEPLKFDGETVYIEVVEDVQVDSEVQSDSDDYEETSAAEKLAEAGEKVRSTIIALATTVRAALDKAEPAEWTIEINLGFKGKGGIPFVTEGEAHGAVKITAKWKRS